MRTCRVTAILLVVLTASAGWAQRGRGGGAAARIRRGSPPQLSEPRVAPTEGYNGIFGYFKTKFDITVKYRDAEADPPRSLTSECVGQGVRNAAMRAGNIPSTVTPAGFTAHWEPQSFERPGKYEVTFQASDKDGRAVPPRPITFLVKNLPLILGYILAAIIGGYLLTNLLALGFCFFMSELPAALLAWALYFLAIPTVIIAAFGLWSNTGMVIAFYGVALIAVLAVVGLAMLQRSRAT